VKQSEFRRKPSNNLTKNSTWDWGFFSRTTRSFLRTETLTKESYDRVLLPRHRLFEFQTLVHFVVRTWQNFLFFFLTHCFAVRYCLKCFVFFVYIIRVSSQFLTPSNICTENCQSPLIFTQKWSLNLKTGKSQHIDLKQTSNLSLTPTNG